MYSPAGIEELYKSHALDLFGPLLNTGPWRSVGPVEVETKSVTMTADALVGRTLASDVLHRMRADIVGAHLLPGERLRFESLRERYRASFSTLREALAHLVRDGLVMAEGQRGFRVAPVSRADLLDLIETLLLIEREALRLSLLRGDAAWQDAVAQAFARLDAARQQASPGTVRTSPDWNSCRRAFHDALVGACPSRTLLEIRVGLGLREERYRTLAARLRPEDAGPVDSRRDLCEAALARDSRRVRVLIEAQIRRFCDRVMQDVAALRIDG